MEKVLGNKADRDYRIYEIPTSALKIDGHKINYYNYISSLENKDCNAALRRIVPRIDLEAINNMIDETPYIGGLQKQFYKTMVSTRKEILLDRPLKKLLKKEKREPSLSHSLANGPDPEQHKKKPGNNGPADGRP